MGLVYELEIIQPKKQFTKTSTNVMIQNFVGPVDNEFKQPEQEDKLSAQIESLSPSIEIKEEK